jgi:uncharacterized RDD family membrane protein YckC
MEILDENSIENPKRYASFWDRFLAMVIDFVLLFLINWAVSVVLGINIFQLSGDIIWFGNIVSLLYFIYFESSNKQATYGKQMMRIRVVGKNGGRINAGQAAVRNLMKIVSTLLLFLGFIIAVFNDNKQALHDMVATTLVVQE